MEQPGERLWITCGAPGTTPFACRGSVADPGRPDTDRQRDAGRKPADETAAELRALKELGVRHILLETRARDVDDMVGIYERFAREVRAKI